MYEYCPQCRCNRRFKEVSRTKGRKAEITYKCPKCGYTITRRAWR